MKKVSKHHDEEGYEDDIVGKVEGSSTSFSRSMAAWQHGSMAAFQDIADDELEITYE
jgi:hypothetical protein